jgi:hypothetical protein
MARPSWQPTQEQRTLVKSLWAMGLPQKQICAWVGMRSPKTLRKHFREEWQQGARAEVVEVRTADETGPCGRCLSITVVLGVGASGSEGRNNSGRKRVARLLASLQNSYGAASLAQSLTFQGAELLDRSASPLRLLPEAKDLLSGAKRASMDSESEGSLGGSKAGERNRGAGNRTLTQAEDEGLASALPGAVWRRDEVEESGASVAPDRVALAGESGRRTERTGAEASVGNSPTRQRCGCVRPAGSGAKTGRPVSLLLRFAIPACRRQAQFWNVRMADPPSQSVCWPPASNIRIRSTLPSVSWHSTSPGHAGTAITSSA